MNIDVALDRWLASIRQARDNDNTFAKYRTLAKQIASSSRHLHLIKLHELSADKLDHWKTSSELQPKRPDDRIGKTTAGRRLEMVKRFTKYCFRMKWIALDPTADFDPITPDDGETLPLSSGRYEAVLAATLPL